MIDSLRGLLLPPLVASVQAGEGSPVEDPATLCRLARASLDQGVRVLRLEGVENIRHIRTKTGAFVIGLIKNQYEDSEVYITPTGGEVMALLETGCEAIALDATRRTRPGAAELKDLIQIIHDHRRVVVADVDTVESAVVAAMIGADVVGTTLSGYTKESPNVAGPDFELLRACRAALAPNVLLLGEGRFAQRWQVEAALRIGADAVVVGGALNDPVKNTRRLLPVSAPSCGAVAAIDIGGTWLRAATVRNLLDPVQVSRIPLPKTRAEKLDWIAAYLDAGSDGSGAAKFDRIGISTGGVVFRNKVTISKPTLPENVGTDFNILSSHLSGNDPVGVLAMGDGHASAWAHVCHPDFAGKNVATLAIGTGLGFGYVREGEILMGSGGEYTRINDSLAPNGETYEELLGGLFLTKEPTAQQKIHANEAIAEVLSLIDTFLFPEVIVVCGTVGMQPWLDLAIPDKEGFPRVPVVRSPFGADAGIHGAAAIALFP